MLLPLGVQVLHHESQGVPLEVEGHRDGDVRTDECANEQSHEECVLGHVNPFKGSISTLGRVKTAPCVGIGF